MTILIHRYIPTIEIESYFICLESICLETD